MEFSAKNPIPFSDVDKILNSYVIKVDYSESDLGLHGKTLFSKILVFLRIKKQ